MGFFGRLFGKKDTNNSETTVLEVCAPCNGEVVSTAQVKDETFSQNMIGKGFAIIPKDGKYVAPFDGTLTLVAETGHAFSIKSSAGIEVIIHIGVDTVTINTNRKPDETLKGFTVHAKTGDKVKKGTPIVDADLEFIKAQKLDVITPVIVINNEYIANKTVSDILASGNVSVGTKIIEVK
jgi:PTS system beta-glucosides-specific IIC component